jgi:hypothetical protein
MLYELLTSVDTFHANADHNSAKVKTRAKEDGDESVCAVTVACFAGARAGGSAAAISLVNMNSKNE